MISWMTIFLGSFATFRISKLLIDDYIMEWLRRPFVLTVTIDGDEYVQANERTSIHYFIGKLLTCYWCTSVWVAGLLTVMLHFSEQLYMVVTLIATLSAVASFLHVMFTTNK